MPPSDNIHIVEIEQILADDIFSRPVNDNDK